MTYKKYSPCEVLQPFVECYFVWESTEPLEDLLVLESPPSGFCSIVFNNGDDYFLQNKKYEQLAVPKQFLSGQSIYSYKLFLKGHISMAGIVLKPTALFSLFNLPVHEYVEERVPLQNVFKKTFLDAFISQLQKLQDAGEKVKLLEDLVLKHFNQTKPAIDSIDNAANSIIERNGMVNINDLLKDVFMSRRNFERRFFKKVGLSPKYYARIRRISFVTNLIAGKKKVDWVALFAQCEFYDQSHFIKDFLEFTGRTPQQYLAENAELANLVEKPKMESITH